MAVRDRPKNEKRFEDFKKQRNKVKSLVRSAKKSYFDKLIELDKSTTTIWKAINEITNKSHPKKRRRKKKKKKEKKKELHSNHFP